MYKQLLRSVLFGASAILLTSSIKSTNSQDEVVVANSKFAMDMLREFENKNSFVSPFSISTAMAMTYAGANGSTAKEFEKALYFDNSKGDFHSAYGQYQKALNENMSEVEWNLANRLWGNVHHSFEEDFLEVNSKDYNAPLKSVDFAKDKSRVRINTWVEENTNYRIKDLIPEGALGPATSMVLTNAVFFKADWEYQFDKSKTKKENFKLEGGGKEKVEMMHITGGFNYAQYPSYKAIQLPYKSKNQSMVVFLPNEGVSVSELQAGLTEESLRRFKQVNVNANLEVYLPKFKMEYSMELSGYFKSHGMTTAFSDRADFSGIASAGIKIDKVIHKAFVEVGEEGTEAAAATAVIAVITSSGPSRKYEPPVFRADHPFIFFILDHSTGTILFMGKVMKPISEP